MTPKQTNKAAVVAVISKNKKVLVIQRSSQVPGAGYWTPPSGKVHLHEEQADAVVREVREEVGLTVRPLRRVWQCEADGAEYNLNWWLAEPIAGSLQLNTDEVISAQWIRPENFKQLSRTFPKGREFFGKILPALPEWQNPD